jgi:hypothetical protein
MEDFNIRSDSIDVEAIMQRIRILIKEKRGVDYTEKEIRAIAHAKLEKFLDPDSVRSDLIEHYHKLRPSGDLLHSAPNFEFGNNTLYESSHSIVGPLITFVRRLLNPVLKLFFNPSPIIRALRMQSQINKTVTSDPTLTYEILNNLVVETTRLGIEVKNLKMHFESLSSRLDFDERRARALESVVEYKPTGSTTYSKGQNQPEGEKSLVRRRKRRSRRRGQAPVKNEEVKTSNDAIEKKSTESAKTSPSPETNIETDKNEP